MKSTSPTPLEAPSRRAGRVVAIASVLCLCAPAVQAAIHPLSGNHRLFRGFVEDGAIVPRAWIELRTSYAGYPGSDRDLWAGTVVAFRFGRDVEAGLIGGVLDRRRSAGSPLFGTSLPVANDGGGLSDMALYGKYRALSGPFDLAAGGKVTIPLGDERAGRGPGVFQYEVFTGMRRSWPGATLVGSVGVAGRGDSKAAGSSEGLTSLRFGAGALIPLSLLWTMVAEFAYESAQFEGEGAESSVLIGFDWRPTKFLAARGGAGAGLTDEAPDITAIFSIAMLF